MGGLIGHCVSPNRVERSTPLHVVMLCTGGESTQYVYADGDGAERQGHRAAATQEGRPGQADGTRRHRRQSAAGDCTEADRVRAGDRRLRTPARPRAGHDADERRRARTGPQRSRGQGDTDGYPARTTHGKQPRDRHPD